MQVSVKMSKKYFIPFLFFPLLVAAQQKQDLNPNGYNKFYYPNGNISSEGTLRNGNPDGYWKNYYETGVLKSEGNRKEYQLDSLWRFYDAKGRLQTEIFYRNGKKNGFKKDFDVEKSFMQAKEYYKNDLKDSIRIIYFDSVRIKQTIPYVEGREQGTGYEYSPEGDLITIIDYKMGFISKEQRLNRKDGKGLKHGLWKEFYSNGLVKTEGMYVHGKKNGYFKEYGKKGELINTVKYLDDVVQQEAEELETLEVKNEYHPNGQIKTSGGFKDGVAEGIHRQYSDSGKIVAAALYKNGNKIGEGLNDERGKNQGFWKEYYSTGELRSEGNYKDGKRVGAWVFYYPNGKIEQKGKYDDKGQIQGKWTWHYQSGNVLREENFLNNKREGFMTEYSDSGVVITKGEFVDGLKEGKWFYELGDTREEDVYQADKLNGECKHYYTSNGKLRFKGSFVDGNPDGKHEYYYENGRLRQIGKYVMGKKEGDWRSYDETGMLQLTIQYKDDKELKFNGAKVKPQD